MNEQLKSLKQQATSKRDAALTKAQADYREDLRAIRLIVRQLNPPSPKSPKRRHALPNAPEFTTRGVSTAKMVYFILSEGKPLNFAEIVVTLKERGHRVDDDPVRIMKTVSAALHYHADKFRQDSEGRWSVSMV